MLKIDLQDILNTLRKLGPRTTRIIITLAGILVLNIYSLSVGTISPGVFTIILLGCIVFVGWNFLQRKFDISYEAELLNNKADSCVKTRQWSTAIKYFNQALFLIPTNFRAQIGKGHAYRSMADFDNAVLEYKKTLELNPDSMEAIYYLGVCYFESNRLQEAWETFMDLLKRDRGYKEAFPYVGDILKARGKNSDAADFYHKYLQLTTHIPAKIKMYERLIQVDPERAEEYRKKIEFFKPPEEELPQREVEFIDVQPIQEDIEDDGMSYQLPRMVSGIISGEDTSLEDNEIPVPRTSAKSVKIEQDFSFRKMLSPEMIYDDEEEEAKPETPQVKLSPDELMSGGHEDAAVTANPENMGSKEDKDESNQLTVLQEAKAEEKKQEPAVLSSDMKKAEKTPISSGTTEAVTSPAGVESCENREV